MLRNILRGKLKFFSKWAIKKHNLDLIVVAGAFDTRIVKDLTYTLLHSKFNVRKLIETPWWDFTVPLTILGYKDKKYSFFNWIQILFRSFIRLLLGGPNPQSIVINLNYSKDETADYWSSFVNPNILVITHFNSKTLILKKLINNTIKHGGKIVFSINDYSEIKKIIKNYNNIFIFGDRDSDLIFSSKANNKLSMKYKGRTYELKTNFIPLIKHHSIIAAISVSLIKGLPLLEVIYSLLKFEMPINYVKKIKKALELNS